MTYCPYHVHSLNETFLIYVLLHYTALYCIFFCTQRQICYDFDLAFLLLCDFYTRLMRTNKIETGRGLLMFNKLLHCTV